jgi:tetratricopeptide (TPR) repeat protein
MAAKQTHPLMRGRAAGLSPAAMRLLEQASVAIARKQPDAAETALVGVLALVPGNIEAQRLLGLVEQLRGDYGEAVAILGRALALSPDDALIHMNLGTALYAGGEFEQALAALQRACDLAADFAPAWFNLGKMLKMQGRPAEAITALHRALDLDPDHVGARIVLAEAQTSLGEVALAAANYRGVLQLQAGHPDAWTGLSNLKTEPFDEADISQLQRALQSTQATHVQVALGFALAKAHEDRREYHAAFRALGKANALKRRQLTWSASAARAQVDAILAAFAAPLSGAEDMRQGEQVIFLVCLPRSGSTLTEQILASHPQVEGAAELPDLQQVLDEESARRKCPFPLWANAAAPEDWARLGRDYLARTERWRRDKPKFTDKNLLNWRLVGAAMAMLPGARVVNCRRDALENCFGCYRQLFASGNEFSYDLDDMASYWHDYDRLSRHWQRLFPQSFFEHVYESLQADPEAQVRRLLAFCGLEYDPACLEFHRTQRVVNTASATQVRQPLRQDTARTALYGNDLRRLRALLGMA